MHGVSIEKLNTQMSNGANDQSINLRRDLSQIPNPGEAFNSSQNKETEPYMSIEPFNSKQSDNNQNK